MVDAIAAATPTSLVRDVDDDFDAREMRRQLTAVAAWPRLFRLVVAPGGAGLLRGHVLIRRDVGWSQLVLRRLVDPATRGDPESPLLWTSKSLRKLAEGLRGAGHVIGHNLVGDLLRKLGYSLQANRKTREGTNPPDRDAQFRYINDRVKAALDAGEPAISVDTKKKGVPQRHGRSSA